MLVITKVQRAVPEITTNPGAYVIPLLRDPVHFKTESVRMGRHACAITYESEFAETMPAIRAVLEACGRVLPLKVDIRLVLERTASQRLNHPTGVGGYTEGLLDERKFLIRLETDMDHPNWSEWLPSAVAHEYNHVVNHQGLGACYHNYFGEAFMSEGLAECFSMALTGKTLPIQISEKKTKQMLDLVKSNVSIRWGHDARDLFHELFLDSVGRFPTFSGYVVSYRAVKNMFLELGLDTQNTHDWKKIMDKSFSIGPWDYRL